MVGHHGSFKAEKEDENETPARDPSINMGQQ